jgi:hypothetical protein
LLNSGIAASQGHCQAALPSYQYQTYASTNKHSWKLRPWVTALHTGMGDDALHKQYQPKFNQEALTLCNRVVQQGIG